MLFTDVPEQSTLPQKPQKPKLSAVPERSPVINTPPASRTRLELHDLSKETNIYTAPFLDQSKDANLIIIKPS